MRSSTDRLKTQVVGGRESAGHLGQIVMLLWRKISFGPVSEEILDDPTVAMLLGRALHSPWHLQIIQDKEATGCKSKISTDVSF
jgi:hypothetical protein